MLLLEIKGTITLSTEKFNQARYEDVSSSPDYFGNIMNLGRTRERFPATAAATHEWVEISLSPQAPDFKKLPKPNGRTTYESNPGIWVFNDSTGITFFVFSDAHRKNAFKGTSIEMALPQHLWMAENGATSHRRGDEQSGVGDGVIDAAISSALKRLYEKLKQLGS